MSEFKLGSSEYIERFKTSNVPLDTRNTGMNKAVIRNHNLRLKKYDDAKNLGITGFFFCYI